MHCYYQITNIPIIKRGLFKNNKYRERQRETKKGKNEWLAVRIGCRMAKQAGVYR